MKKKYTGDLTGDYKENKEVFGRLKDVAKALNLTEVTEDFTSDNEQMVYGYLQKKTQKGRSEVTIREVDTDV